jgi:hypothetical protein
MPVLITNLLFNSSKTLLETSVNSQPMLSPLKPIGQKRGGAVFYCTLSSKECSLLQPYIVVDNNQEHSNEELVMHSCLWRKVVGSKYIPTKHIGRLINKRIHYYIQSFNCIQPCIYLLIIKAATLSR